MKSNYITRAKKFLAQIAPYLERFKNVNEAVCEFNYDHRRNVIVKRGMTRYALLSSDYVVKWDYNEQHVQRFGGCENEFSIYQQAENAGYGYLFAQITPVEGYKKKFYIMPRIDKIAMDAGKDCIDEYLTEDEQEYIYWDLCVGDIHDENWGFLNGDPVLIDYACVN